MASTDAGRRAVSLPPETTARIELSAGTIEYEDTGGAGPAVVLLHGLMIGRIVLVSCDAFENFPPGVTGKTLVRSGRAAVALSRELASAQRKALAADGRARTGDEPFHLSDPFAAEVARGVFASAGHNAKPSSAS